MADTKTVKRKIELAQKHIAYQRGSIARDKELIAELKRDKKLDLLPVARELLKDLEHVLAGMIDEQFRARDELFNATTDPKRSVKAQTARLLRMSS